MKILFAAAEVAPFSKVGGLADVAGALPWELARRGLQVQVISPMYKQIDCVRHEITKVGVTGSVRLEQTSHPYEIAKCTNVDNPYLECLFVHNRFFFGRQGIYTQRNGEGYLDNNARFIFFQKVLVDLIRRGILRPDLIHINDHHTALLPFLLDSHRLALPALLTVHNFQYQGQFGRDELSLFGPEEQQALLNLYPPDMTVFNALELGIRKANHVNTVSPTYARELLADPEQAFGLQATLKQHRNKFSGILNGADYSYWNPAYDRFITANYGIDSIPRKQQNKKSLLERCGLPADPDTAVLGSISRLVESKGFDLILDSMGRLLSLPVRLVFLGTGYQVYQDQLRDWAEKYPERIAFNMAYDEPLAHLIEAGADLFLMPSRFEPCGLNQIYSLKYGTPPIVHRTGGLADTVSDWDGTEGNGFVFADYSGDALLQAVLRAVTVYREHATDWEQLIRNAMTADFSWEKAASDYMELYQSIIDQGAAHA
ncbi:MAG: glycogen synthase [Candidatus Neomarinimicrobiota bacterium]